MKRSVLRVCALAACTPLLFACDPEAAGECEPQASEGGKADAVDDQSDRIARVEELVLGYWQSWQDADWDTYRASFADSIHVDAGFGTFVDPDVFTEISKSGHPFRDVVLVDLFAHEGGATLVYEAVDTVTEQPLRVSELITVGERADEYGGTRLVIEAITAVISTGPAPRHSSNRPRKELESQFAPFFPDQPDGPSFVLLWGDIQSSSSGFLLRTPAGFPGFDHVHSAGYHGIVLEGTVRNGADPDESPDLTPGSYWSQAAGEAHVTACRSDVPCLSLVMFDGPFDAIPADG